MSVFPKLICRFIQAPLKSLQASFPKIYVEIQKTSKNFGEKYKLEESDQPISSLLCKSTEVKCGAGLQTDINIKRAECVCRYTQVDDHVFD